MSELRILSPGAASSFWQAAQTAALGSANDAAASATASAASATAADASADAAAASATAVVASVATAIASVEAQEAASIASLVDAQDTAVTTVQQAADDGVAAVTAQEATSTAAVTAQGTTSVAAVAAQQGTSVAAVQAAQTTATTAVTAAQTAATTAVGTAQTTATTAVTAAQSTAVTAVAAQQATSVAAVVAAGIDERAVVRVAVRAHPVPATPTLEYDPVDATPATGQPTALRRRTSTAALDANILRGGRGFASRYLSPNGATVTDGAAAGYDGRASAASRVFFASGNGYTSRTETLPAGTYTLSLRARSRTGADQAFRMSALSTGTTVAKTATSAWARFTLTFTRGSAGAENLIHVWSADGATGLDLDIDDLRLDAGSTALDTPAFDGATYFGRASVETTTLPASTTEMGILEMGANAYGLAQLDTPVTISATTFFAAVRVTSAPGSFASALANAVSYQQGLLWLTNGALKGEFGSVTASVDKLLLDVQSAGWHLWGFTYDPASGGTLRLYFDDIEVARATGAQAAISLSALQVGQVNWIAGSSVKGALGPHGVYSRALSAAEWRALYGSVRSRLLIAGQAVSPAANVVKFEGDSITEFATAYPTKVVPTLTKKVYGSRQAVSGSAITHLVARSARVDASRPVALDGRSHVLVVLIGANDLTSYATAQLWFNALTAYTAPHRAAGTKVVVLPILPRTAAGFNTRRAEANALITAGITTHFDAVVSTTGLSAIYDDSAASNATYYSDGTHMTDAGHAVLAPAVTAAIEPFLV